MLSRLKLYSRLFIWNCFGIINSELWAVAYQKSQIIREAQRQALTIDHNKVIQRKKVIFYNLEKWYRLILYQI